MDKLFCGDIIMVEGGTMSVFSKAAYLIFNPSTRLFHGLGCGVYMPDKDDYKIQESISSGVRGGYLSWYADDLYVVFRQVIPDVEAKGIIADEEFTGFGRWGYDYPFFFQLAYDIPRVFIKNLIKEHRFRRIRPEELKFVKNRALYCTEGINASWAKASCPIVPEGVNPIPAAIAQAYIDGRLKIVWVNIPKKYYGLPMTKIFKRSDYLTNRIFYEK